MTVHAAPTRRQDAAGRRTDLRVSFGVTEVVRGVSLSVAAGECVAIVGESGSGKSVTARSLVGLAGPGSGRRPRAFDRRGRDAPRLPTGRTGGGCAGRFAGLVLQDALVSLDPLRTVGAEIGEVLRRTRRGAARPPRRNGCWSCSTAVGVPDPDGSRRGSIRTSCPAGCGSGC